MNALLGELRMVKVLHQQSGVCLFTHQWKWNLQAHAEGVDALVMSFTQFAREIDGGGSGSRLRIDISRLFCEIGSLTVCDGDINL